MFYCGVWFFDSAAVLCMLSSLDVLRLLLSHVQLLHQCNSIFSLSLLCFQLGLDVVCLLWSIVQLLHQCSALCACFDI